MAPVGLILAWGGYTLLIFGYTKWRWSSDPTAKQLSISDLALPSHRTTYINALAAYTAGGTTSLSNPSVEVPTALAQAQKDLAACQAGQSGWWGSGGQCDAVKQRIAHIMSINPATGKVTNTSPGTSNQPRYKQWLSDLGL